MKNEIAFKHWLAGLIDGEGHFGINISRNKQSRFGYSIAIVCQIALVIDDIETLEMIKKTLEIGSITTQDRYREGKPNHRKVAKWRITNLKDCLKLRDILINHPLRAKKRKDYLLWCEALEIFQIRYHRTKKGFLELALIRDELNMKNNKQKKYRRFEDFVEEILDVPASNGYYFEGAFF